LFVRQFDRKDSELSEQEQRSFLAEPYIPIEVGPYEFEVAKIEGPQEGKFGPQLVWHFKCLDPEYDDKTIKAFSSASFNPRTKTWEWTEAVLGRKIQMGERIGFDDLVGQKVIVHISHDEKERGTFEKVQTLTPIRRGKQKPAPQAKAEDEPEPAAVAAEAEDGEVEEGPPF
jgi:hypothetical protein